MVTIRKHKRRVQAMVRRLLVAVCVQADGGVELLRRGQRRVQLTSQEVAAIRAAKDSLGLPSTCERFAAIGGVALKPAGVVMHPRNGIVFKFAEEDAPQAPFWVTLGNVDPACQDEAAAGAGFVLFERVTSNPGSVWKSTRWHPGPSSALGPTACRPIVLWTSRGVAEAVRAASPSAPLEARGLP